MSRLSDFRAKLESKVFTDLGSTATLYPFASYSSDKWDNTAVYASSTAVTVVPYGYSKTTTLYQVFGDLKSGEVIMLVKYSESLNEKGKDKIVFDNDNWIIMEVTKYFIQNGNITYAVRLAKDI